MRIKLSLGSCLATLFLFFLPWVDVRCVSKDKSVSILTQSGIQTIIGTYSISEKEPKEEGKVELERYPSSYLIGGGLLLTVVSISLLFRTIMTGRAIRLAYIRWMAFTAVVLIGLQLIIGVPIKEELIRQNGGSNPSSEAMSDIRESFKVVLLPSFYLVMFSLVFTYVVCSEKQQSR